MGSAVTACPACAEPLPAGQPSRCPSCGERLVAEPRTPDPPWRPSRKQVVGAIVGFVAALGVAAVRTARARAQEARAARLLDPAAVAALPSSSAIHARVGERWTLRRATLQGAAHDETWDVLGVGAAGVLCRIEPSGGPARVVTWRFASPLRRSTVMGVTRETLVVAGRPIDCDVVDVWNAAGFNERVWLWIAMDRVTDSPTFPGVVRRDTEGDRGRSCRELEVVGIAPITSP